MRASALAFATICLVIGATAATTLAAVAAGQHTPAPTYAPNNLTVTNPRICAAEAVYRLAKVDDWGLRATIATAIINGYRQAGRVPDCAEGVSAALTTGFAPERWQAALDAVDAVMAGDYIVSPAACARATAVVPLNESSARPADLAGQRVPRAQCVIYGLAFVEAHR